MVTMTGLNNGLITAFFPLNEANLEAPASFRLHPQRDVHRIVRGAPLAVRAPSGFTPALSNFQCCIDCCESPGNVRSRCVLLHGHGHEIGIIHAVFRNNHAFQKQPLCSPPARRRARLRPSRPFASYASLRAAPRPSGDQRSASDDRALTLRPFSGHRGRDWRGLTAERASYDCRYQSHHPYPRT